MEAAIVAKRLRKRFDEKAVLDGVDLEIPRGTVVGLLGTNGSGKTTFLKCLVGLLKCTGESFILGEPSWSLSPAVKAKLGYVPQVINIYPWMRVGDYIRYTASFYTNWNDTLSNRLVTELEIPTSDRVGTLSVGQLQRLAILTALSHEPEVLILDEPAASLDPVARRKFLQLIIDLAEPGKRTVLFSTHITSDLERVADRVAVLKAGQIAYFGLLDDLKEQTHLNLEDAFMEMHRG
jgi:ABC-2 type transport system ATP-binding protein